MTKGVTIKDVKAVEYEEVEEFWSDEEILELFPDEEGSLVNRLLRRAQKAEETIEKAIRVGHNNDCLLCGFKDKILLNLK